MNPDLDEALNDSVEPEGIDEHEWLQRVLVDALVAHFESADPLMHARYNVRLFAKAH